MSAARRTRLLAAGALALAAATVPSVASAGPAPHPARHVLLISVDGMHESDLQWYVVRHPGSRRTPGRVANETPVAPQGDYGGT